MADSRRSSKRLKTTSPHPGRNNEDASIICPLCCCGNIGSSADDDDADNIAAAPSHFTGCLCRKSGICMDKAASKVLNDEGVVRKYNALLSRVSKSSLWEDAIERNASCKTVEVGQRVCLACWNYDKNTMSTNDGLPRYWVMIVSPQLQNILDSEKVCKLCSYRHGVLLEYADDVEFTPNLVRQKVPSQLLESVRVFLAKIYGFPTGDSGNILTGNEKELCWQHWCHWYYGLPEKLQRICEGKYGDAWLPFNYRVCVVCDRDKHTARKGTWTLAGAVSCECRDKISELLTDDITLSDFDWVCPGCRDKTSDSSALLDDAVVDPAADTQPCSQPPPNNEVGNDVTLTFEPCHNLNIDWDCAEALLIDYRHTSEMYCSAGGNDDHVSMATSASHMALAVAINDLKLHGFSTYSTIRFTFQMGFQDLATDAGVDNVLWHRWLPRLRSEMLKMISTIKCGVYKLQQGSGNGMVNHGLQNSSMLLYDQSCYIIACGRFE